jgi:hypothetical protein
MNQTNTMIARDDCSESDWEDYEPDLEDLVYELARERELESYRLEYDEIMRLIRASAGTDRQLRNANKESKSISRDLFNEHRFDVAADTYDVDLDGETSITVPRSGMSRDEVPRAVTRKDKRRAKTTLRKAARQLQILTKRGCSPRQVTGYEDKSFTTVVAAV